MENRNVEIAARIRKSCEDGLEELARLRAGETGEDFYTAYSEVCGTALGKRLLRTHDEAYGIQVGL